MTQARGCFSAWLLVFLGAARRLHGHTCSPTLTGEDGLLQPPAGTPHPPPPGGPSARSAQSGCPVRGSESPLTSGLTPRPPASSDVRPAVSASLPGLLSYTVKKMEAVCAQRFRLCLGEGFVLIAQAAPTASGQCPISDFQNNDWPLQGVENTEEEKATDNAAIQ